MATLAIQPITNVGLVPTYTAAAGGGDKAATGPGLFLHVKNGAASAITVTLETPQTVDGLAVADREITVGATAEVMIALPHLYRHPADGLASIAYSAVTSVTVAAVRAPVAA